MIKEQVKEDSKLALKSGDHSTLGVLRMLLSSVSAKEKEKRYKLSKERPEAPEEQLIEDSALTDEQMIETVSSEIKKRKDAVALYEQGNRPELADREKEEIEVLKKYLPEQLSQEALRKLVQESIRKTGASEVKDMGKIMADLMPAVKGKADTTEIARMVKELLAG